MMAMVEGKRRRGGGGDGEDVWVGVGGESDQHCGIAKGPTQNKVLTRFRRR